MTKNFIVATKNKGKITEIKQILTDCPFNVLTMEEAGFQDDIEETGTTFEENSMIKAKAIFEKTGQIVMSDDSGLEIDFLNGAPGVLSARFAGEHASDLDKINKILLLLKNVPPENRIARFVCCITLIIDKDTTILTRGICEGLISAEPSGTKGFGYDPIFFLPEFNQTMATLSSDEKNKISHRGKALSQMKIKLLEFINNSSK